MRDFQVSETSRAAAEGLRGVIGFPVTPFLDDAALSIDWDAFCEHVDVMADGGLSALVVAGGTGEMFSLTTDETARLAREAVKAARGRVKIVVGTGVNVAVGRATATAAAEAGADGLLVLPPYYPNPDPDALVVYYRDIAKTVPDLAVIPYSRGAAKITPEILRKLADVPNITAFKDGQGDVRMFQRNRQLLQDRFVWLAGTGDDLVGPYVAAGAEGFTSSIACFDPALALELWRLASGNEFEKLSELSLRMVAPWYELRTRGNGYEVSVMKAAMEAFGHRAGPVRPPLAPLTPSDGEAVRQIAATVGLFSRPRMQDRNVNHVV